MNKLFLAAAIATLGFAAAPAAMAQTPPNGTGSTASNCTNDAVGSTCEDADMDVHVAITGRCQYIEVGDLEFGTHRTISAGGANATYTATTQVDVACNTGTTYDVSLDYGVDETNKPDRTAGQRYVSNGSGNFMQYTLRTPSGAPWGDGTRGDTRVTGTGNNANQSLVVNGTLTQTAGTPAGDYTDLVIATLTLTN